MDIIRTGLGITKTIKNVTRAKEILSIFARNGFDEFIIKSGLNTKIPGFVLPQKRIDTALSDEAYGGDDWWKSIGYRLRKSFEELGPSFIKLGQLLATREDLFPATFIEQMKFLQNKAMPIDFSESKKIIEKELGKDLNDVFESFNSEAIGVASIGVVYQAVLKGGQSVVVKVRRPGIAKIIKNDFDILDFLISQMDKVSADFRLLGTARILEELRKNINLELNFLLEGNNCEKLKKNLERLDKKKVFVIPNVYREFSTEKILVLEYLNGQHFNELKSIEELSESTQKNLLSSVNIFIHTLLVDGFFHADLHGGNFLLLEDGKIGIIDFGLMGTLSQKNRANLAAILYALISNNYENLVYEFLDVADFDKIPNDEALIRDIRDGLSPYVGLSIQETNVTELVSMLMRTLTKHHLYLPREWLVIFRAIMTLDGVGKSIGLDLNIFNIIHDEIDEIMKDLLSKNNATEELMWISRDAINTLRVLPRHIRWFLKEASKKKYALEINLNGHEKPLYSINQGLVFLGHSVLSSVLLLCGVLFIADKNISTASHIPTISWVFWSISLFIFLRGLWLQRMN
ncbi:MAG: AarF/ABC1/UbiB kinase family protein [Bacteriovoracaceae bacterium]|nr:AarF/ABC1/UbiB kinase family protein [Bacteriovoracaceae bacterium]